MPAFRMPQTSHAQTQGTRRNPATIWSMPLSTIHCHGLLCTSRPVAQFRLARHSTQAAAAQKLPPLSIASANALPARTSEFSCIAQPKLHCTPTLHSDGKFPIRHSRRHLSATSFTIILTLLAVSADLTWLLSSWPIGDNTTVRH